MKKIENIMEDLRAWQNEKEGRAVSVFLADDAEGCSNLMYGKRLGLVASMAFYALRDNEIKEMMQDALDAVEKLQK